MAVLHLLFVKVVQAQHSKVDQGDGTPYSEVCGRIIGYQHGDTQLFGFYVEIRLISTMLMM